MKVHIQPLKLFDDEAMLKFLIFFLNLLYILPF